jgi:undecaprenyl diphosphate synthase
VLSIGIQWRSIGEGFCSPRLNHENTAIAAIKKPFKAAHTFTAGLPDPDLFIRTGGERRISNFLLWQIAYSELYFTDVLWPDFDAACLDEAFDDFAARERRFGKTSEQLQHA